MDIQFGFDIAASISIIGAATGFVWSLYYDRKQKRNQFAITHLSRLIQKINRARLKNDQLIFSLRGLFLEMGRVEKEEEMKMAKVKEEMKPLKAEIERKMKSLNCETEAEKKMKSLHYSAEDCISQINRHLNKTGKEIDYFANSFLVMFATDKEKKAIKEKLWEVKEKQKAITDKSDPRRIGEEIASLDRLYGEVTDTITGILKKRNV